MVWRREVDGTEMILWTAVCANGGQYAAIFNAGEKACSIAVPLTDLEIYRPSVTTELWSGKITEHADALVTSLAPHSAAAFLIR